MFYIFAALPPATWLLTFLIRNYTLRQNVIDIPNARSSHTVPTPLGGGLAIAAVIALAVLFFAFTDAIDGRMAVTVLLGGIALAAIGWIDDMKDVSISARLGVQIFAGLLAAVLLSDGAEVESDFFHLDRLNTYYAFFTLAAIWILNGYNFMDGTDGLAAVEAVTTGLIGGCLLWGDSAGVIAMATGLAVLGFLPWNWPPARIFMGDAGSGFLGFVFACVWIGGASVPGGFFIVPVLLAVFIVDTTLTLLRRIGRGEKWYASHRSHIYQAAAAKWGHARVATAVLAVNVLWLAPCAALCRFSPEWAPLTAVVAYAPLIVVYLMLRRRIPTLIA